MDDKQKIAFLCHPYHRGGVTRWMADAATAFVARGAEVYFVTVDPVKEFHSAKGRETLLQLLQPSPGLKTITTPVGYEFEFGTPQYRAYIYKQLLAQLPPGIPVILSDDKVVWQSAVALSARNPVVGVLHADENHYYRLAEQHHQQVAVFTCVSRRVHRNVEDRMPRFDPRNIFTIPCGIYLPLVNHRPRMGGPLRLAFVGRVSNYQKRAGDIAKICAEMAARSMSFHIDVIGDGDARATLEAGMTGAGFDKHITFHGWLSQAEVTRHLADTDVLLLTSDFEGTPIAMMEALAAGCGMVGTRVSGIEDYEFHPLATECIGIYEVGNIYEAVNKIQKLASVPPEARRNAAREIAETEFSMDICIGRYQKAISMIPTLPPGAMPPINLSYADQLYSKVLAFIRKVKTGQ